MKKLIFSALVLCSTTRIFYAMETQLESTPSENQWEDILANASERIGALVLGSPEERSAALCLVNASINDLEVNDPKYKEILMEAGLIVALEPNNKTIKLALKTYNSSLNLALDNSHGSNNNEKIASIGLQYERWIKGQVFDTIGQLIIAGGDQQKAALSFIDSCIYDKDFENNVNLRNIMKNNGLIGHNPQVCPETKFMKKLIKTFYKQSVQK